jgi:rubrerythrin
MAPVKNFKTKNMHIYICEVCGEAHVGSEKPFHCSFCGAKGGFLKLGSEADPIVNRPQEIGEVSRKNLLTALQLEKDAAEIYTCMAGKAENYEIQAMYKRLAKIELEHAVAIDKLLNEPAPVLETEQCSAEMVENFQRTIALEKNATALYAQFAKEAEERDIKIFFGALAIVEREHIELIEGYLK